MLSPPQRHYDKLDPFKNRETLEATQENPAEINNMMMRIQLHQVRYIFSNSLKTFETKEFLCGEGAPLTPF